MKLSRKWLNEFIDLPITEVGDRAFAEAMSVSGSKVEATDDLTRSISGVICARVLSLEKHPDSDHMFVAQLHAGPHGLYQVVTGAWNVHKGDLVPLAVDGAHLPNGMAIRSGRLRGVESQGMLCSLKELNLTTHDFPEAEITAAAVLQDYHPLNPDKPSISSAIAPGDKIFGPVVAARVNAAIRSPRGMIVDLFSGDAEPLRVGTPCTNLHAGDLVALNTKSGTVCTLADLRAEQAEFPHCIPDGIFVFPVELTPGAELSAFLGYDDHIVDFEITPNRPDCLCMLGLAREAAVTFSKPLHLHTPVVRADAGGEIGDLVKITIEEPSLCRRYTARMVKNVKIAPSPAWMRERIRAAGMRPINNLVDITNYVMLEYGQPMHAFDFSCVKNAEIRVRLAKPGESIKTLDGTDRPLSTSMLCICDTDRPVGVAGVMGGENSEIVGDTAMVLFESANFDGASIRRTATALGMRTDASSRYEKGLDPENTLKAVQRACELVELLGAGEVVEGIIDAYPSPVPETVLHLDPEKINRLLGTDLTVPAMLKILQDLGFSADTATPDNPIIHVPSWRADVVHYSDLAEEVARFYGYNNIPTRFTSGAASAGGFSPEQQCENRVGEVCRSLGMDEIITYSFISPSAYDRIRLPADSPLRNSLKILNPLGEDTSVMRTTILPSMLEILTRNYNYRNPSANFYEIGRTYHPRPDGLADETKTLSLGAYGPNMNFYKVKGWAETILSSLGISGARFVADAENPSYHPGRCADILVSGETIGVLGQIHPRVMRNYSSDFEAFCAQLSFDALFRLRGATPVFKPLPRFPAVSRDIAVVCPAEVPAGDMVEVIKKAGGMKLVDCRVFDVYQGHHIEAGKKSVAFSLSMRSDDGTLTDADADEIVKNVLKALKESFSAEIR